MADNVAITAGSGTTIAADDIGSGVLAQRVKPVWGPDGTGNDVDVASGLPVQSGYKAVSGSSATPGVLFSADALGYSWINLHITNIASGTASFEQSGDNTNWVALPLAPSTTSASSFVPAGSTTSSGVYSGPIAARYVRASAVGVGSGTMAVVGALLAAPVPPPFTLVANSSTSPAYVRPGVTTNAMPDAGTNNIWSGALIAAYGAAYNGSTWDRLRTPTTFKSVTATASGNSAVWVPNTGKKFRLMRYKITVTADAAQSSGGVITIGLQDNTTDIGLSESVYVPATAAATLGPGWSTGWIDLGNGRISSSANQTLNVNCSAALTSGTVRVVAAGTEE